MRLMAVFLLAVCAWPAVRPAPVWIDTDPSVAPGGHEIDDGIALLQAFGSRELRIRGVSIVFGNADLPTAVRIGREIVRRFGPGGLRVYTGASGAAGLGVETEASRALAKALKREPLTVLVLGPATNVATVVKLHPELAGRMKEVISVAGRRPGQHFTAGTQNTRSLRDFNFEMDPPAFQVLLDSKIKLSFAPWEVSSKVWLTRADLDPLASNTPGVAWLMPAVLDWLKVWNTSFGVDGFNPFDALAVGYVVDPDSIVCSELAMRVERGPDDTSQARPAAEKPYLLALDETGGRRVRYCHTPSTDFKARLLRRLAASKR